MTGILKSVFFILTLVSFNKSVFAGGPTEPSAPTNVHVVSITPSRVVTVGWGDPNKWGGIYNNPAGRSFIVSWGYRKDKVERYTLAFPATVHTASFQMPEAEEYFFAFEAVADNGVTSNPRILFVTVE